MRLDPRTAAVTLAIVWLAASALSAAAWWTRRRYDGFGRFAIAGPATALALMFLSLRHIAPDWVSVLGANGVLLWASLLYLEGARAFRGLPPHHWSASAGGLATMGIVALFTYGVPTLNGRAAAMSAYLAIVSQLTAVTLLRAVPPGRVLGLRLTGSAFALCAATHVVRAAYFAFGPRFDDLALSGASGALFVLIAAEMSVFPVGLVLAGYQRMTGDLEEAAESARRADAEVARQRAAESVLRESERRFRAISDTSPVMIWVTDIDQSCTYVNRAWLEFTGRSFEAELGNGWADGIHPDDRAKCLETWVRVFEKREPLRMEYRVRRRDGAYRWIIDSGAPAFDGGGAFSGYVGSAVDVTDLRVAKEALSTLSRRLMEAQEQERDWIARELHDDLAQRAAAIAVQLHNIARHLPETANERLDLQQTCDVAADLAKRIQLISYQLHSSKLEYLGLATAAAALCRSLRERHGMEINLLHEEEVPKNLSKDVSLCVFRVLQEALNNAVKHAGVRQVVVTLHTTSDEIHLSVADRGVGFDPAATNHGLGIISMTERLNLVGGEIRIESCPGAGTTVRVRVPLHLERRAEPPHALA
ncbi:MAG TPA: PAS domain S-box protein [Vicinamibacterales bacterium]|nr:PAS domain S-box protein [Vicinamibacterales bacterium]